MSKNCRHCSRDDHGTAFGHARAHRASRLRARRRRGLASRRRARGNSDQCCAFGGRGLMAATVATVAYLGLEARAVEVQVQLSSGLPRFTIVGLPDKAVAESRERVRAALGGDRPRASAQGHHRQPVAGRPAQGRLALRSADRACACWRRSARPMPRRCRIMSRSASCASTGGSPPRRACFSPRSTPRRSTRG